MQHKKGRSVGCHWIYLTWSLIFCVFLVGCRASETLNLRQDPVRLATDFSSLLLAEDLLNAQEDQQAGFLSTLTVGSRDMALAALEAGEVDAVLMLYAPEGQEWFHTPIAREWLVFVVPREFLVEDLSREQVQALFVGQMVTWQIPGGPDMPVQIISPSPGSSSRQVMSHVLMNGADPTAAAQLGFNEEHIVQLVSQTPGSIGYVVHSMLDGRLSTIALDGVEPSRKNAASRNYPIVVDVVLVAQEEPQGKLRDFLDWVLSEPGQDVVERRMLGVNE